jgi:hypothetical protein
MEMTESDPVAAAGEAMNTQLLYPVDKSDTTLFYQRQTARFPYIVC